MKFIHSSSGDRITKENFVPPKLTRNGAWEQHDFNLDGGFYLSKADEEDSSMWLKFREKRIKYPAPKTCFIETSKKIREVKFDESFDDSWVDKNKHFYDVDFEKHKIYVVDSIEDIRSFFIKYGNFSQKIYLPLHLTRDMPIENYKILLVYLRKMDLIESFLETMDEENKSKIGDTSKIDTLKARRNFHNLPYINIRKKKIIIPKKGINFEFLVDLIRTKEYYENMITKNIDIPTLRSEIRTTFEGIDFIKLNKEGYNGVYYGTNVVRFLEDEEIELIYAEKLKLHSERKYHGISDDMYMKDIDIGDFPRILPDIKDEELVSFKKKIEFYFKWLGSDTLLLWNWVF